MCHGTIKTFAGVNGRADEEQKGTKPFTFHATGIGWNISVEVKTQFANIRPKRGPASVYLSKTQ